MEPLDDPGVAVVTGGGGDLGRATALRLARDGAAVALLDSSLAGAQHTLDEIEAAGGRGIALEADVTRADTLEHAFDAIERTLGGVAVLVNSAGIAGAVAPIDAYPEAVFDRVMAVNVKGVLLVMQAALPRMARRGHGAIVNVASTSAIRGRAGLAGYVASKHAVLGLTRVAALDAAGRGVRVNAVLPGPIAGRMIESIESQVDGGVRRAGAANFARPEDVANVIAFLASEEARHMNGAALVVDDGSTLM
ncbi:SDR family NAD(P)-dependent oxidoreductase [Acuticoccus mangrovi]|uniref:SDR family oxidoreductase n=1 Tax=Acuticoccus mangrovi TaxID=2796142 RepID=A0A934IVH5_9HYPH|nr:SDR family NAD(P)-dependent oxidoreductase [Acuticoccus mangrovi]MBJ3778494.1 SDR family oxidoreductase [Acuticoccus mangrovi]